MRIWREYFFKYVDTPDVNQGDANYIIDRKTQQTKETVSKLEELLKRSMVLMDKIKAKSWIIKLKFTHFNIKMVDSSLDTTINNRIQAIKALFYEDQPTKAYHEW